MKQIIAPATENETVTLNALFTFKHDDWKAFQDKIIVQVYEKEISILQPCVTPPTESTGSDSRSFAFQEISKGFSLYGSHNGPHMNMRTDGENIVDALDKIKERIKETIQSNRGMKYYVFDSLAEFAAAVLENGWK